jgi:hypothetical protein
MNYRRIEKGTVIGWEVFYVVVNAIVHKGELYLNCICDNANNIYSNPSSIKRNRIHG